MYFTGPILDLGPVVVKSGEEGKDQALIQSSTTPDLEQHMGNFQNDK